MDPFENEIKSKNRFPFGKNWARFLSLLNENRIKNAEKSLQEMLLEDDLRKKTFLDAGSGSGLFSLAARRLGAAVFSFDYDPNSVECGIQLKNKFFPDDGSWKIERGSILDQSYVESIGKFDIVYSWGVLHHTGQMRDALQNIALPLKPKGKLFIAIYNDQGFISNFWRKIKGFYCSGTLGRWIICLIFIPYFSMRTGIKCLLTGRNEFSRYNERSRGMSIFYDWLDWLGGYPFETATPAEIKNVYEKKGFKCLNLKTTTSLGNNEFVFEAP